MNSNNIRKLVLTGIFIALNIVMTRFLSTVINLAGVPALRLSFGEIPLALCGILLGPFYGAACGAVSDFIGYMLNSFGGAYFPGFTISAALTGFIPGIMFRYLFKSYNWKSVSIVVIVNNLINSVILNTIWLSILYSKGILALLPARIFSNLIMIPIYIIVLNIVLRNVKQYKLQFV